MSREIFHKAVLGEELLNFSKLVDLNSSALFIDCTLGEGGHSFIFLNAYPKLRLIAIDIDKNIQERARERLEEFKDRIEFYNIWFDDFFSQHKVKASFILSDLGISMYHYKASGRGFSFSSEELLDMRLDSDSISAYDIVNNFSQVEIEDILYSLGEERFSRRIARAIIKKREEEPIKTAKQLSSLIFKIYPIKRKIHPATKTFQALRIYVNSELDRLKRALPLWLDNLGINGILAVITFHSLEDRIVKHCFKRWQEDNKGKIITKKPIIAQESEINSNSASRSAKLRVFQRTDL